MTVDLDGLMRRYRECARHVWNTAFQPLEDGWHEFIGVERALFSGLVLVQAGLDDTRYGLSYIQGLRVRPVIPPAGFLEVFLVEPPAPGVQVVNWRQGVLRPGALELRFMDFFDWADRDAPQDFRFVRARVLSAEQPGLSGCDVLLEFQAVTFERVA
jgi:hypothetical protein